MNDYTRALHQRFYQEPENTEEEREMNRAEQARYHIVKDIDVI
ncbi:hypothetical protein [Anaerotruncus colihominis]|nr:hypothetical protein [Anaerotruncus colihominis]